MTENTNLEERFITIEMMLAEQEKEINDLSDECVRINKILKQLTLQQQLLLNLLKESPVKPESEETPPPHY